MSGTLIHFYLTPIVKIGKLCLVLPWKSQSRSPILNAKLTKAHNGYQMEKISHSMLDRTSSMICRYCGKTTTKTKNSINLFSQCIRLHRFLQDQQPQAFDSQSKCAWPWSWLLEWAKVKCKYANQKRRHDFLFDDNIMFALYLTICEISAYQIKG